jgi:hypothetical protein
MWRGALLQKPGTRNDLDDNITEVGRVTGSSKAYTVSRLKRQAPELYEAVKDGKLSANAAAIQAGFRGSRRAASEGRRQG